MESKIESDVEPDRDNGIDEFWLYRGDRINEIVQIRGRWAHNLRL
jgi:hypothetical protein